MNFLSRMIVLLIMSLSVAVPAGAGVAISDGGVQCDFVAADDDKKPDDEKQPEGEGDDEEPECD